MSGSVGKGLVNMTHHIGMSLFVIVLLTTRSKAVKALLFNSHSRTLDKTVLASGQHNSPKSVCWSSLPRNKFSDDEVIIIPLGSIHDIESRIESATKANSLRRVLKITLFTMFKVETPEPL